MVYRVSSRLRQVSGNYALGQHVRDAACHLDHITRSHILGLGACKSCEGTPIDPNPAR